MEALVSIIQQLLVKMRRETPFAFGFFHFSPELNRLEEVMVQNRREMPDQALVQQGVLEAGLGDRPQGDLHGGA